MRPQEEEAPRPPVRRRRRGAALTITLDRPERRNALDDAAVEALLDALQAFERDPRARVLILEGAGEHFCAGRELSPPARSAGLGGSLEGDERWSAVFRTLSESRRVSVAVVRGYAVAGGCTLAMACDLVLAERTARFGALEMRHGFPAAINTPLLARLGGGRVGLELALTGELMDAERLYEVGLVNRLAPDAKALAAELRALVSTLEGLDPAAVAMTKALYRAAREGPLASALDMGTWANALIGASGQFEAAARAFRKKGRKGGAGDAGRGRGRGREGG